MKYANSILLMIALLFVVGCQDDGYGNLNGSGTAEDKDRPIAIIDNDTITLVQYNRALNDAGWHRQNNLDTMNFKKDVLHDQVVYRAARIKARDYPLVMDEDIQNRLDDHLQALMRQMLFDNKIQGRINITQDEIKEFYNDNLDRFKVPASIVLARIVFLTDRAFMHDKYGIDENAPAEVFDSIAGDRAQLVYNKIKSGADFAEMARQFSDDTISGKKGGVMMPIYRGQYEAAFDTIAFGLPVDSVSAPIKTDYGYNIIKVLSKNDSGYVPIDSSLTETLRNELAGEQSRKLAAQFFDSLVAVTDIVYNQDFIKDDSSTYDSSAWMIVFDQEDTVYYPEYLKWQDRELKRDPRLHVNSRFKQELLYKLGNTWLLIREARKNGYQNSEEYARTKADFLFQEKLNRLMAGRLLTDYEPDSAEIEAYYQNHPDQFSEDTALSIQQVILDNEQLAMQVKAQIDSGADFYQTALKYYPGDEDEIKSMAINLGWINRDDISPDFFDKVYKLKAGDISDPIKTRWGYHIVKVLGKKGTKPLQSVKIEVRKNLINEKKEAVLKAWQERMLDGIEVKVDKKLLEEFVFHKEWLPKPDFSNMFTGN